MPNILAEIEEQITPRTVIPKPRAGNDYLVKGWGMRRQERALVYKIPNRNNPNKPYEKGISTSEWVQAFERLRSAGEFSRSWFNQSMSPCAKEGSCNFTTIGGIFERLGFAAYERGVYRWAGSN